MQADRLEAERRFFDDAYASHEEQSLNGFYSRSAAVQRFHKIVLAHAAGRNVLEFGCGTGGLAFRLADRAAHVIAVDISDVAVENARSRGASIANLRFEVANAESLPYEPNTFDLVCGTSILHHLDIKRAVAELRRVLRPAGKAIFYEPVGYNPLANLYRWLTPALHTADEHPLVRNDFAVIRDAFPQTRLRFCDLFSVAAIPLLPLRGGGALLRALEAIDTIALHSSSPLRLLANVVIIEMQ